MDFFSSSSKLGEIVRKSTPASAFISPTCAKIFVQSPQQGCSAQQNFVHIAERGTHDDRLVPVLLVVVEDLLHRLNTWIFVSLVSLSGAFLVPIEDLHEIRVCKFSEKGNKANHLHGRQRVR